MHNSIVFSYVINTSLLECVIIFCVYTNSNDSVLYTNKFVVFQY